MSKGGKVFKMSQSNPGVKLEKKPTRVERLEIAVKQLAGMPQFLLQRFQDVVKVVEDIRFTYEIIGQILQDKGIITQEDVTAKGKIIIEQRKKEREEHLKKLKEQEENINKKDTKELKSEVVTELMQPREDLQKDQIQDKDVSIKKIE
jgi:Na+/phosphate symporter